MINFESTFIKQNQLAHDGPMERITSDQAFLFSCFGQRSNLRGFW